MAVAVTVAAAGGGADHGAGVGRGGGVTRRGGGDGCPARMHAGTVGLVGHGRDAVHHDLVVAAAVVVVALVVEMMVRLVIHEIGRHVLNGHEEHVQGGLGVAPRGMVPGTFRRRRPVHMKRGIIRLDQGRNVIP